MILSTEIEYFLNKIDCKFPYNDSEKAYKLIKEALEISDYCVYGILHEIVYVPRGEKIDKFKSMEYLDFINDKLNHPYKDLLIPFIIKVINHDSILEKDVLSLMGKLERYTGYYVILSILLMSVDNESEKVLKKFCDIENKWEAKVEK